MTDSENTDAVTTGIQTTKCGFVAIIGAPNAGKSTLLNALVGTKVAIVTHKVQTTRTRIAGIVIEGLSQIVFVDTPGIFAPKRRLDRAMVSTAWQEAGNADFTVLLIDARRGIDDEVESIMQNLEKTKQKVILALNKVDLVQKDKLLILSQQLYDRNIFTDVFMISALKGSGIEDLKHSLAERLPESPWLYPEDQVTDITQRILTSEITREQVYLRLHQELPYAISVVTDAWEEKRDGSVKISQTIFVERKTQKGIVIGKGGTTLKAIGATAREEMMDALDRKVHLFLFVKVSENWSDSKLHYLDIGLDYVK